MCNPDCIKSFWLVVCTTKKTFFKHFGRWLSWKTWFYWFLIVIMAFKHVFGPSLPINRLQKFTISHTYFSSSFYNDVFPSLAFHRKRSLWKSIRGHMIGQHGRGKSGYEVGLSGRKFDHHGLLLRRGPCAPSVSPPTVKLLVCPISWSHWYIISP